MSSSPILKFDNDIAFMKAHLELMTAQLVIMHGTLHEIVKMEVSLDGGIAMKGVAEIALCEVHRLSSNHFQTKSLPEKQEDFV